MVCNCRAEISPRPVSQDVHLCTTFYLYRLNYVAHTLQILCFCQQLVCFWGDKSRTDDKQPISVSVDSVRLDTLQIVIAHTGISRVTTPERLTTPNRIWIMISFSKLSSRQMIQIPSPSCRLISFDAHARNFCVSLGWMSLSNTLLSPISVCLSHSRFAEILL